MASSTTVPRDCITCDGGCGQSAPAHRCSNCQLVYYCGRECQRKHYKEHKPDCRSVAEMRMSILGLGEGAVLDSEETSAINKECAICLESEMKNPIVLKDCKHAFCSGCLLSWQERKQRLRRDLVANVEQYDKCPLCRSETTDIADTLFTDAHLCASRAYRPGCSPEEQQKYRQQALAYIDRAMESNAPSLNVYFTKIEVLLALKDGAGALKCLDELVQVNEERNDKREALKRRLEEADSAVARRDEENAEAPAQSIMDEFEGLTLGDSFSSGDTQTHFEIELRRAEAYELEGEWLQAMEVYFGMLDLMTGPEIGTPPQQRKIFMGLSRCAYELGVYDRAIAGASAAMEMNRHYPGVHKQMALAQKAMGDLDAAITTMNRAVLYETPWDEVNKAEVLKFYNELLVERSEQGE